MRCDLDPFAFPPVVAAARRRMPRHLRGGKKTQNNYVAENRLSLWPNSGNRTGGGARGGNQNAAKTPAELRRLVAWSLAMRRRVRLLLAMREAAMLEQAP